MKAIIKRQYTSFLLIIPLWLFFLGLGCEKEESNTHVQSASALILYYGDPSVDGCGWLISTDENIYAPTNLDSIYHSDSLRVILDYDTLFSSWNCGWRNSGYKEIKIYNIKLEDYEK